MKNLFIDSNIWLSLYHFTSDDLTQFEKLKDFLDKDIRLWIPHQVYDEVLRNREAKIQDAFKKFEFSKIQYPVFCRQYDEYTQFTTDYNELCFFLGRACQRNRIENRDRKTRVNRKACKQS